jgi:prolyl 4-hydroxylase
MENLWFGLGVAFIVLLVLLWIFMPSYERGFVHEDSPWDPPHIVSDVLTPEECKYIIEKASPDFARSSVVGKEVPDPSRTSQTAWISKHDPVARKVFEKAIELTGKTIDDCEDLQIVKYEPGTFYNAHHDSCCDDSQGCIDFEKDGGQRVGTLLVYLNSDFTDGETHFPSWESGPKLKAPPGSAIFFRPLGRDEPKCHPKALHAGLPISTGTKYVCNAWVRENKFRL